MRPEIRRRKMNVVISEILLKAGVHGERLLRFEERVADRNKSVRRECTEESTEALIERRHAVTITRVSAELSAAFTKEVRNSAVERHRRRRVRKYQVAIRRVC